MDIKTMFLSSLLLIVMSSNSSCSGIRSDKTPATVEEAEALLAKKNKKALKQSKKAKKRAYKTHWRLQSKEVRKSIKRNKKRHRRNNTQQRVVP